MYKSPITEYFGGSYVEHIKKATDDGVYTAVVRTGFDVDKEELKRALQYDRRQYERGYADGKADAEEIVRCRECEWWEKQPDSLQGYCALMHNYPTGSWYCGNARRRIGT